MPLQIPCARRSIEASPSDEELLAAVRGGSQADFNTLYQRYFQRVYNFTYLRLRNHADTEEVVQETFTAVFRSVGAFEGKSSLLSWIYGIAKNNVNNHLRRSKARELRLEKAEPELLSSSSLSNFTPEEQLTLQRCTDAVQERLAQVADWQAEIFVLRHVENLSIGEIASRMSRSNDAVRSSLYRVKRLLIDVIDQGAPGTRGTRVTPRAAVGRGIA